MYTKRKYIMAEFASKGVAGFSLGVLDASNDENDFFS